MSAQYVSETGFQRESYAEIVRKCEAVIIGVEPTADLSPEQPFGQIVTGMAELLSSAVEGAQEVYTSRSVAQVTGSAMDERLGELGMSRLLATSAHVDRVLCWTHQTAASVYIPAGSQVRSTRSPLTYSLGTDISIGVSPDGPFDAVRVIVPVSIVVGTVYALSLNGAVFSHTAIAGDSTATVTSALVALILAAGYGATAQTISSVLYLRVDGASFTLTALTNVSAAHLAVAGAFTADSAQAQLLPAYWLDKIETPASYWAAVEQPADGLPGTDMETDTQARMRIRKSRRTGTATDEAIRAALLRVDGVSSALVVSNRTMTTDTDGRPPKSFEAIVTGGTDVAVAATIWRTMPSGIENWAPDDQVLVTVLDSSGQPQPIKFARPAPKYAHVKVVIVAYSTEQVFPAGGVSQLQNAIAAFGNANFALGGDVVLQQLLAPVYSVPGIRFVDIQYALTDAPTGTPIWTYDDHLVVGARNYASFDATRVVVAP